jgi:hypothetical protein
VPVSAAAQEEQDRRDDEDDHEDRSNDADAKCCDHDRASLFKSAQTRTISDAPMMTLPSAYGDASIRSHITKVGLRAAAGKRFLMFEHARLDPQTLAALELLAGSGSPMPTAVTVLGPHAERKARVV